MIEYFDSTELQKWFLAIRRDLPWRQQADPYSVWISEIMLQQTQVSVVIPYFERWMTKFPTIIHLADAKQEEVIKIWEGLGYYSRARNIHEGAKYLKEHHEGKFPSDHRQWEKIKGIGPYTAGAIRSFAFHQKAIAVDGNVLRVLSRYFNLHEDLAKSATLKKLSLLAEKILPETNHWIHNEALIELGALICGRIPNCKNCPLKKSCLGYQKKTANLLPLNSRKTTTTILHRGVIVCLFQNQLLVKKCEPKQIMAGLYEFPYIEIDPKQDIHEQLLVGYNIPSFGKMLKKVTHSFTRFRANLYPYFFEINQSFLLKGYEWIAFERCKDLPFSSGHRQIFQQI